jgi:hypothetical protein
LALGVALRIASGLGHHHGQVTAKVEGMAHARFEQRRLQASAAEPGQGGRTGEQSDSFVEA